MCPIARLHHADQTGSFLSGKPNKFHEFKALGPDTGQAHPNKEIKMNAVQELNENELPPYDTSDNPTNCCPRFDPTGWNDRHVHFKDKLFLVAKTRSFFHIPINMGKIFTKTLAAIETEQAMSPDGFVVLSRDTSKWTGEHYFSVCKAIPGQTMVRLSGDYQTRVFEGPFKNVGKWCKELAGIASGDAGSFFFYTTCPKCAKQYGKNYVVGFAGLGTEKMESG